ncbi:MAG TPA: DUF4783 domain-containing protein [Bacteroidales bacterium]|jgi:hypothetical protein|nr:DUF4783 domain-containing protein [Bacteroidales bacterium]HNV96406.1 DUF4783 domain-containing protein [Bacteroidales bacterium]HOU98786.1 DUF4783 domain-containing protein [Bacteroidales bacterium]
MKTLLTFFLAMITTVIFAQTELPSSISNAIKNGNAAELTKSFNINVDLTLLDKQDIYSKTQAESLLKDFFTKNIPSNFTVIHRGGKEDAQYYVGKLTTSTGNYRISILIKGQAKTSFIHQFRIEKEND